jgi:DNA-binding response OmpR family regulator
MLNILIVDDQPYLYELFPHGLMEESCHVTGASDTESVKRCLADSMPDIVLLEISLHGFEGWEVLHYIKSKNPHLLVLIVTAYDNYAIDPRACESDGYMVKDFFHLEKLKEKITKVLVLRRQLKISYPRIEGQTAFPLFQFHAQSAIT